MPSRRALALAVALLALTAVLTACDEDEANTPLDMATIWPHADGSAWSYAMDYSVAISADAPPAELPSMAALRQDLLAPLPENPDFAATVLYDLALEGEVTTDGGVTAQHMVQTLTPLDGPARGAPAAVAAPDGRERLLRLVARGRPDLRARIGELLGEDLAETKGVGEVEAPFLLGGYAFAYEDSGYYGYSDIGTEHSRIYLEGPLMAGQTFSQQLLPGLADDVVLRGKIWSVGNRYTGQWNPPPVVECMYVLDLGLQEAVDEQGNPVASFRSYFSALIWYSPGVGPIAARERHLVVPGSVLQDGPWNPTTIDFDCDLEAATLPPADETAP